MKHLQNLTLDAAPRKSSVENIILVALFVLGGLGMYFLFGANSVSDAKPQRPVSEARAQQMSNSSELVRK
jgi:hypothetical protein